MASWQLTKIWAISANKIQLASLPTQKRSIAVEDFGDFALFSIRPALACASTCVVMLTSELSHKPIGSIASSPCAVALLVRLINSILIKVFFNDSNRPLVQFLFKFLNCRFKLRDGLISHGQLGAVHIAQYLGVMLPLFIMILVPTFDGCRAIPPMPGANPAKARLSRESIRRLNLGKIDI